MEETHVADPVDLAGGGSEDGHAPRAGSPERAHDPVDGRVDLPEPPERLYAIHITSPADPSDPVLAAALQEMYEAAARDPNSFRNNPDKAREARDGLGKLLDEWEAENGAFTEEELARARARAVLTGVDPRS
ncbi:MAG: hypothetical protein J4G11_12705 [Acidimicrobiia bacterium]|nr:hypothetical protein [Acidimicrobiia bacterium]